MKYAGHECIKLGNVIFRLERQRFKLEILSSGQNWKEARILVTCSDFDVDFLPHREHWSNITKTNRSVLFREVICVSCENHMGR
jgi:hypothetical protein